jgi:predicted RNase H-like nuclease
MATYASLGVTDKAVVDNTVNLIRGSCSDLAKIFNRIKSIVEDTNATGLVVSLDNGEVVPNTSGLAGADDLTKEEVIALFNFLSGIRTTNDTAENRDDMSKAAGINAMMGGGS